MIRCLENGKHQLLSSKSGELSVVRKIQSKNLNQLRFHQARKQLNIIALGSHQLASYTLSVSVDKRKLLTRKLQDEEVTRNMKQNLENERFLCRSLLITVWQKILAKSHEICKCFRDSSNANGAMLKIDNVLLIPRAGAPSNFKYLHILTS